MSRHARAQNYATSLIHSKSHRVLPQTLFKSIDLLYNAEKQNSNHTDLSWSPQSNGDATIKLHILFRTGALATSIFSRRFHFATKRHPNFLLKLLHDRTS